MKSDKGINKHTELQTSPNEIEVELTSNSSEESISSSGLSDEEEGPTEDIVVAENGSNTNNIFVGCLYSDEN